MRIPIARKSSRGRSVPLTAESLVNMYAEEAPGGSKSEIVVHGCPGFVEFSLSSDQTEDQAPSPDTLYMTRFADGTNSDIGSRNIIPVNVGTGHDYSPTHYLIDTNGLFDYFSVDVSTHLSVGDDFVVEALIEHTASSSHFTVFLNALFFDSGDGYQWGVSSGSNWAHYDTPNFGTEYTSDPVPVISGPAHYAIQFQYISGTDYTARGYYNGIERHNNATTGGAAMGMFYVGASNTNIGGVALSGKVHEIAVRKELKYPDGTSFTPPTTLDNP